MQLHSSQFYSIPLIKLTTVRPLCHLDHGLRHPALDLAEPGGQEPLRPPEFIPAGPHETDQGVSGRLPLEQIRQVRLLLASAYGPVS